MNPLSTSTSALDLLDNSCAVLQFLAAVTPAMHPDRGCAGLNQQEAYGLTLIINSVAATIAQARDQVSQ